MLLSLPLIAIHEPPFGPIGLALFIVAVLLFLHQMAPRGARSASAARRPVSREPAS